MDLSENTSALHGLPLDVYLQREPASWLIVTEPVWQRLRQGPVSFEVVWQFHAFLEPDEKLWVLRWRADPSATRGEATIAGRGSPEDASGRR